MPIETLSNPQPAPMLLSYSHTDEGLLNDLKKHLAILKRQGVITTWHDRDITAGDEWAGAISRQMEEADVILLLISPDFIASDYCWDVEMKRAMERHDAGEALVIPVFLRPCDWKGAIFGKLKGLPTDAKPITSSSWSSHDEAFTIVAAGIRNAIANWRQSGTGGSGPRLSNQEVSLQKAADTQVAPSYKVPKLRPVGFNAYQADREILAFLNAELVSRMKSLEEAGYIVDRDAREGKIRFRVIAGDQTVYFLHMWQGGLGNDKGLGFFHGWGNRSVSEGSTTATATPVPDEYTGEAKLDVLNMSLLGHGSIQKTYTKEEFVDALWDEIVRAVDQLGFR